MRFRDLKIVSLLLLMLAAALGLSWQRHHHRSSNSAAPKVARSVPTDHSRSLTAFMNRPLAIEPNQGQDDKRVRYHARGNGYQLFMTDKGAVVAFNGAPRPGKLRPLLHSRPAPKAAKTRLLNIDYIHARKHPKVEFANPLPERVNYYRGNDPSKWHSGIHTYGRAIQHQVWKGVDLAFYGNRSRLECDFIVAPGADPHAIALGFGGADSLTIDSDGALAAVVGGKTMKFLPPMIYQPDAATRRQIDGRYVIDRSRKSVPQVRFDVASYDRRKPLVIDPSVSLTYSTYLGGDDTDEGFGIKVGSDGSIYVTGVTDSFTFPVTLNAFQTSFGEAQNDAFVTKFCSDGTLNSGETCPGGGTLFRPTSEGPISQATMAPSPSPLTARATRTSPVPRLRPTFPS